MMKTKYRQLNNGINSEQLIKTIIEELKNINFNNIYNHIRTQ